MGLWEEFGGECERQTNTVIVTSANTDTQVIRVPWTAPANKFGVLEQLHISNQHASTEVIVKFFDAEEITAGTPGSTLPPDRGTAAAPLLVWYNVPAGTQLVLDKNSCPNVQILSGLSVQCTVQPVHICASIITHARG